MTLSPPLEIFLASRVAQVTATLTLSLAISLNAVTSFAHGTEFFIGSTAPGSGVLMLQGDFEDKIVVTPSATIGDQTLYGAIIPSFAWTPEPPLAPLPNGVPVDLELIAIVEGASLKLNGPALDRPGQTARIGTSTDEADAHEHVEWQLILPNGVTGEYAISFKLKATEGAYADSPIYTVTLTNVVEAVCGGDCNDDSAVSFDELVATVNIALGAAEEATCEAGDVDGDEEVTIDELVAAAMRATDGCGTP